MKSIISIVKFIYFIAVALFFVTAILFLGRFVIALDKVYTWQYHVLFVSIGLMVTLAGVSFGGSRGAPAVPAQAVFFQEAGKGFFCSAVLLVLFLVLNYLHYTLHAKFEADQSKLMFFWQMAKFIAKPIAYCFAIICAAAGPIFCCAALWSAGKILIGESNKN